MPAWPVKTQRAPSRHSRNARVYGHTTTAMHEISTPPPPTLPHATNCNTWPTNNYSAINRHFTQSTNNFSLATISRSQPTHSLNGFVGSFVVCITLKDPKCTSGTVCPPNTYPSTPPPRAPHCVSPPSLHPQPLHPFESRSHLAI